MRLTPVLVILILILVAATVALILTWPDPAPIPMDSSESTEPRSSAVTGVEKPDQAVPAQEPASESQSKEPASGGSSPPAESGNWIRIVSTVDGRPIAGARLLARAGIWGARKPTEPPPRELAQTDADGLVSIPTEGPDDRYAIEVSSPGFACVFLQLFTKRGSRQQPLIVRVPPAASIVGSIKSDRADDRATYLVDVNVERPNQFARTTARFPASWEALVGRSGFRIDRLPAHTSLSVTVTQFTVKRPIRKTVPPIGTIWTSESPFSVPLASAQVYLKAGEVRTLDLVARAPVEITGVVRDQHGQPIAKAEVRVSPANWGPKPMYQRPLAEAKVNEAGEYRLVFRPKDACLIQARFRGGAKSLSEKFACPWEPLPIPQGVRRITKNLTVTRGLWIEGRVIGPDNRPVRGLGGSVHAAKVTESSPFPRFAAGAVEQREEGSFLCGPLLEGTYRLSVYTGLDSSLCCTTPVQADAGARDVVIRLSAAAAFVGSVTAPREVAFKRTSETGTGYFTYRITATNHSRDQAVLAIISLLDEPLKDRHGFRFGQAGLSPGRYSLVVTTEDGWAGAHRNIELRGGEGTRLPNLHLKPAATVVIRSEGCSGYLSAFDGLKAAVPGTESAWVAPGREVRLVAPPGHVKIRLHRPPDASGNRQEPLEQSCTVQAREERVVVFRAPR